MVSLSDSVGTAHIHAKHAYTEDENKQILYIFFILAFGSDIILLQAGCRQLPVNARQHVLCSGQQQCICTELVQCKSRSVGTRSGFQVVSVGAFNQCEEWKKDWSSLQSRAILSHR